MKPMKVKILYRPKPNWRTKTRSLYDVCSTDWNYSSPVKT